jgi:5-methylcytosine-specific restriction endonuclease McrA
MSSDFPLSDRCGVEARSNLRRRAETKCCNAGRVWNRKDESSVSHFIMLRRGLHGDALFNKG